MVKNLPAMQETQVQSLGQDDPREMAMAILWQWRREWQSTPIFLSGKFHGQRNLGAIVHRVARS